jgi:hypothetical protein
VIASAAVALVWLAARRRLYALRDLTVRNSPFLAVQVLLGVVGATLLLMQPAILLASSPEGLPAWTARLAEPAGWMSLVLAAAAAAWYLRETSPRDLVHVLPMTLLGVGVLLACHAARWPVAQEWLAYHVLMVAWAVGALLTLAVGWLTRNVRLGGGSQFADAAGNQRQRIMPSGAVAAWVTAVGAEALALAVVHSHLDSARPWWSLGTIAGISLAAGLAAIWLRLPVYVFISGLLFNVGGTIWWMAAGPQNVAGLASANALAFAAAAGLWTIIDRLLPTGALRLRFGTRAIPFAHAGVIAGLATLAVITAITLIADLSGSGPTSFDWLAWTALAALAAVTVMHLWDRAASHALPSLYAAGLIAIGMSLDVRGLQQESLAWNAAPELAAYVLAAAAIARLLHGRLSLPCMSAAPNNDDSSHATWFGGAQLLFTLIAAGSSVWIAIGFGFDAMARWGWPEGVGRLVGPITGGLALVTAVLMAGRSRPRDRHVWQHVSFALAAAVIAEVGWALLSPEIELAWLHRNVILMASATLAMLGIKFALPRVLSATSDWLVQSRQAVAALAGVALVMLAMVLAQEGSYALSAGPGGFEMHMAAVVAVAAALAGLIVIAIVLAVQADWDPFHLSDDARTAYVYAAEALGGLMALHIWLAKPHLFQLGIMEKYWMLIVMAIAFAGAGLSEYFRRRRLPVLSKPLERTAALLPLFPAVGFWLPSDVSRELAFAGQSPAVWFLVGLFYGALAVMRRSAVFAILAAIAGNVGLGVTWWYQLDITIWQHPQLYFVPLGITLLVAEYLNHDRLKSEQSTGLRYLALCFIYLSSAAEFMFLHDVGSTLWLPMALVVLSVLGVLAGIVLRVQSFLLMGLSFLVVVLVRMIWYASFEQHQIWVFCVFCLVLGLAIVALFGVLEKHRERILAARARWQQWER